VSTLRLGTRGSQLALFQARLVAKRIEESAGAICEIVIIKTSGDRLADMPLSEVGGKRLFVKEIEDALLKSDIDLAVHSSKDMPAELPDGLAIPAVLPREDPSDALVLPSALTKNAKMESDPTFRVGTGSVRRIAQLRVLFPRAQFENIRGNLDTRLRKLDAGEYDALVLATAGLRRLGFESRISTRLSMTDVVPAPGQGIIAVETRADDSRTRERVSRINDPSTFAALEAERAVVAALGGGCQMPIGAVAVADESTTLVLHTIVASLDGARAIRYKEQGSIGEAGRLGRSAAEHLLKAGAQEILNEARNGTTQVPNH